ncbi:DUF1707 and DUF4870 domain-containing protein [Nocardiopsis sp. MT53]|uniref:DUF1707 and DUF4870 domain-containing protein n=1 Tax=Nocardiopsis changdeensis TaxID=2831969 RepID=A0ABX8BKU1_9ACTN|nr:DUF1707 and DUF4870 domain-containing protein [Nocardiopsis flavescens]QUX22862.1 DUF1707 and DUF4870 domain-containing protein [Nocardiopsis changdeensis]QYX38804.1 DUF1707 and DUF4870 domain-containing protein [Nocardiopsis sp. MT53]
MQEPQHPVRRPWERPQPQIRLTHADRDAVTEVLREAYGKGQLDEDEFEERLDRAMRAKFGADLEPLTQDLGLTPQGRPAAPAGARAAGGGEAPESTSVERVVAGLAHAGNYFFPLIAPLVLFLGAANVSPYVRRQALESLNFQLACIIGAVLSLVTFWLVVPMFFLVAIMVGWAVIPAIGTIAALMGKDWRYPLPRRLRLVKDE